MIKQVEVDQTNIDLNHEQGKKNEGFLKIKNT